MSPAKALRRLLLVLLTLFVVGALLVPALRREAVTRADLDVTAGQEVHIHTDRGKVRVHRGRARVEATATYMLSSPDVSVRPTAKGVSIDATCPSWAFLSCSTDIDVAVPADVKVAVLTARGPITIEDASDVVSARSDLGRVTISGDPVNVNARSVEGDVTIRTGPRIQVVKASSETADIYVVLGVPRVRTLDVVSLRGTRTVKGVTAAADAKGTVAVRSGLGAVRVEGP